MQKSGSRSSRAGSRKPGRRRRGRPVPGGPGKADPGADRRGEKDRKADNGGRPSYLLPLLSGILAGTSYIPFPPWALLFFFVPLWLFWLREASWKRVFLGGWATQFLFTLIGFHWVAHTAHEFGHLSWFLSALVLLLFCSLGHLYVPLAGLVFALLRGRMNLPRWAQLGLLPALTALGEYAWPMIFPYNLGYAWLWGRLPVYQLAEYMGFQGLSALTIFLNLAFLAAWESRGSWKGARILGAALAFFAAANLLGWLRGESLPPPDARMRPLIVQANIGNLEKEYAEWGRGFREEILRKYFDLTARGWGASEGLADFALWPETAFPDTIYPGRMDEGNTLALREFLRNRSIPLVTGARGFDEAEGKKTNALFFFNQDGKAVVPPYNKTTLLVFGEYLPGARLFPWLRGWFPFTADFARGNGPGIRRFRGLVLGPQICYEGLFPSFSRVLADQGAQAFVNVTNDSWFGTWAEPRQHLFMTLARGIEFRRPVIRATNTGISTAMLADGTILNRSPIHREWFHAFDVPYREDPPPTFYQRHGYRLVPASLVLAVGILLAVPRRQGRGAS